MDSPTSTNSRSRRSRTNSSAGATPAPYSSWTPCEHRSEMPMTHQLASMNADELIGTLMSPSAMQDPYPIYDRLRDIAPNHLTELGVRFVSTHDICMELLKSKDFGQSFGFGSEGDGQDSTFIATIKESLILSNPPRHTRLRKLVSLAFSARMIKELTPRIQERLDDLMDDLDKSMTAHGSADLVKLVAEPLPALVLGEMLGARDDDRASLCEWEEAIANANKPILDGDLLERADWATRELHAYIKARVEERRGNPGADIISVLTRIESEGQTLTEVELINVIWTIMAAGSQTTTTTLTTSMYLLLQQPETRAALVADPSKIPTVLDEIMRYESPVQNTFMR